MPPYSRMDGRRGVWASEVWHSLGRSPQEATSDRSQLGETETLDHSKIRIIELPKSRAGGAGGRRWEAV